MFHLKNPAAFNVSKQNAQKNVTANSIAFTFKIIKGTPRNKSNMP